MHGGRGGGGTQAGCGRVPPLSLALRLAHPGAAHSPPRPSPATHAPASPKQNHSNEDIYEKAVAILEAYFDVEDGEEENLAPAVAEGGTYAFGAPQGFGAAAPAGGFNFGQ